ncbi:protein kinase domain-containing protein, partial [Singulisphaera rosea]
MNAPATRHTTDQVLRSYGLGELDDASSAIVESHLVNCTECRSRLTRSSAGTFFGRRDDRRSTNLSVSDESMIDGALCRMPTTPPTLDSLPQGLVDHANYEIKRELGHGGMGVVYLAHNTMMGRDEVLKVIGRHVLERPGVLERFQREIRAVARLCHPNIVTAYSAFRLDGGLVFAMEYVEGLDLARLVQSKGPLPVSHAAYFAHQAALGLQHAHERGMVHRDVKPHNLMLTHDGKSRVVKILDFGLAKANREQKLDSGLTSEGQALGSPDYNAPEQILNAQDADIRADIYSLGATLFYLLTGRPPFIANSLYDLYQAHISRDVEPLNLLRPEVPSELAALVSKMMTKDPTRRFQTPAELHALTSFFKPKPLKLQTRVTQAEPDTPSGMKITKPSTPNEPANDLVVSTDHGSSSAKQAETPWNRLIDFREPVPVEASPLTAPRHERSRWFWPTVSVAFVLGVLCTAWIALSPGKVKVKTSEGFIVLENVPKDSVVLVDGDKVSFNWPGDNRPLEIQVVPGKHKVQVEKGGFRTFGESVTVKTDGSEEVTVRLEPLDVSKSGDAAGSPPALVVSGLPNTPALDDFKAGSVWVSELQGHTFKILERGEETFKASLKIGEQVREAGGILKNGYLHWPNQDANGVAGDAESAYTGEIKGDEIALSWSTPGGLIREKITLRLSRPAEKVAEHSSAPSLKKPTETELSSRVTFDPDTIYRLTTCFLPQKSLDFRTDEKNSQDLPVQVETGHGPGQQWRIYPLGDGWFRITSNSKPGKSLDLDNTNFPVLADTTDNPGQRWKFTPIHDGWLRLINGRVPGKSLDVMNNGSDKNGLYLANTGNWTGQLWKVVGLGKITGADDGVPVALQFLAGQKAFAPNTTYRLTTCFLPQKSLDFRTDERNRDLPVQVETGNVPGQRWRIYPLGDGWFRITSNSKPGKSLDLDNTNFPVLADTTDNPGQRWKF